MSVLFENCEFFINMKGNSFSYKILTYVIFNEETSFHFLLPGFLARKNSEHALIRQNIRREPGFVLEFRSSVEKQDAPIRPAAGLAQLFDLNTIMAC